MRNFVIGDVHGHYTFLMQLLSKLQLEKDDVVYLVGDILDRAPSPEEQRDMIDWCINNVTNTGQFRMVLGNHEFTALTKIKASKTASFGSDEIFRDFLLADDNSYFLFNFTKDMCIDWNKAADFFECLPVYYRISVKGTDYIIAHSWVCSDIGLPIHRLTDGKHDKYIDTERSVKDRHNYLSQPMGCCIIHGHYPTTMEKFYAAHNPSSEPIGLKIGRNVNVDTCCFNTVRSGNLTAYCIEDDNFIYLWDKYDKYASLAGITRSEVEQMVNSGELNL